jgi:hypothetical protein
MIALNESSPEKAGVGGSIPSLATTFKLPCFKHLQPLVEIATLCENWLRGVHLESKLITAAFVVSVGNHVVVADFHAKPLPLRRVVSMVAMLTILLLSHD